MKLLEGITGKEARSCDDDAQAVPFDPTTQRLSGHASVDSSNKRCHKAGLGQGSQNPIPRMKEGRASSPWIGKPTVIEKQSGCGRIKTFLQRRLPSRNPADCRRMLDS